MRLPEQRFGIERRCIGFGQSGVDPLALHAPPCSGKHLLRDVEAEETCVRIMVRHERQIAPRSAAQLQHRAAFRYVQPADQPVAPKQIIFARQVVDMALAAIDAVHQAGVAGGLRHGHSQAAFT